MFRKILIANRGEIALRVLCACKELGVATVAVYSEADRNALHVRFADEAICIGPPRSSESYLNIPQVISAAEIANVDAIHPGYGFLSENANFAEVCEASHITFIGPSPGRDSHDGRKGSRARGNGGGRSADHSRQRREWSPTRTRRSESAKEIGFPLMIKAVEGGGGRGMRMVRDKDRADRRVSDRAQRSGTGFRQPERVHGEADRASAAHRISGAGRSARQRDSSGRARMFDSAAPSKAAGRIAVAGAGREDARRNWATRSSKRSRKSATRARAPWNSCAMQSGKLYFIEMNARIQVEHPVTEMVTGVDLVKSQIRIAAGEKLDDAVGPVEFRGHAIECRINAEDPDTFVPSPGRITAFRVPGGPGIRVDTAGYADAVIPPYYDSLVAKLIAHGRDRSEAIARMHGALDGFVVEGIKTTIPLHKRILADPDFVAGKFDTHFLERLPMCGSRRNRLRCRRALFPPLYAILDRCLR